MKIQFSRASEKIWRHFFSRFFEIETLVNDWRGDLAARRRQGRSQRAIWKKLIRLYLVKNGNRRPLQFKIPGRKIQNCSAYTGSLVYRHLGSCGSLDQLVWDWSGRGQHWPQDVAHKHWPLDLCSTRTDRISLTCFATTVSLLHSPIWERMMLHRRSGVPLGYTMTVSL